MFPALLTEPGHLQQPFHRLRQRPVPVDQLGADRVQRLGVDGRRELAVRLQPQPLSRHVVVRDVGVDGQVDPDLGELLLGFPGFRARVPPEGIDRLTDQPHVEVEADARDVPGLLGAEDVARTADFQVLHRDRHARAELGVLRDRRQPVVRGVGQRLLRRVQEVGVPALARPPDSAAQLVQLGEAEQVRAVHDQRVGVGDVQAGFHDRGTHQHVVLALPETLDDLLQPVLVHLPVRGDDPRLRHQFPQLARDLLDVVHAVVHEENLAVAQQLAPDRGTDLLLVVRADVGQHGVPLLRRGEDGRHLPDARHAHLQRPRNRGRRHGQHVHMRPQGLDVLLVLDAEALLLVDDHQTQILVADPGLQQPVRADHDVDRAAGQALDGLLGLHRVGEPRQSLDRHRERPHPVGEGVQVLLGEQRGRHQHGDLLAVLHRLERRAHRDLGLAVTDVAADHPVHRHRALHVRLDLVDGGQLITRLGVGEGVLQFPLPRGVSAVGVPGRGLPRRIQLHQLGGDLLDRLARLGLGVLPVRAAEPVQRRHLAADVTGDLVELVGRHEQPVAGLAALARRVLQHQVLAGGAADGALHHLDVLADPVLLVHHEVAGLERQRIDCVAPPRRHPAHVLGGRSAPAAGEVRLGEHHQRDCGGGEAVFEATANHRDHAGTRLCSQAVLGQPRGQFRFAQLLHRALRGARTGHHQHGRSVGGDMRPQVGEGALDLAAVGIHLLEDEPDDLVVVLVFLAGQLGQRPPRQPGRAGVLGDRGQTAVRRRAQVDRRFAAVGGDHPGRLQEFLAGAHQVGGAGVDLLRIREQHVRARRNQVGQ